MNTEIVVTLVVLALVVAYGVKVGMSGKRGRPQGPMI